jgi:DNA-binding XRE family transcriptional regulator
MEKYHYTESGLENVYINGLKPVLDDDGDEVITVPYIAALHAEIARGVVTKDGCITGPELRFLRTEMGMTQSELGKLVNNEGQTIGHWERGEFPVDATAETIIRRLAGERLIIAFDKSIEELIGHIHARSPNDAINIQANQQGYSLIAA